MAKSTDIAGAFTHLAEAIAGLAVPLAEAAQAMGRIKAPPAAPGFGKRYAAQWAAGRTKAPLPQPLTRQLRRQLERAAIKRMFRDERNAKALRRTLI